MNPKRLAARRGRLLYDGAVDCGPMTDDELAHLLRVSSYLDDDEPMGLTNIECHALSNRIPAVGKAPDRFGPIEGARFNGRRVVVVPAREITP